MTISLSRQIANQEAVIAYLEGRKQRPRPSELEAMAEVAKAALETLRAAERLPADFLKRAEFYVG